MFNNWINDCWVKPDGRFPMYNLRSVFDAVGRRAKDCTKFGFVICGRSFWGGDWGGIICVGGGRVSGKRTWVGGGFINAGFDGASVKPDWIWYFGSNGFGGDSVFDDDLWRRWWDDLWRRWE